MYILIIALKYQLLTGIRSQLTHFQLTRIEQIDMHSVAMFYK